MARTRGAAATKANSTPASDSALTCPECGKTFTRPASLGAHRNRAHGIAGASTRSQGTRTRRNSRGSTATRRNSNGAPPARRQNTRETGNRNSSGGAQTSGVNRDDLLQALFPHGLPAREAVIRRAHAWLDEAEELARAR